MRRHLGTAMSLLAILSVLTGMAYPLVMTGVSQLVFPERANGSLIVRDGKPIGSSLIGQRFSDPKYFWGRPSATSPPYNAGASSGSNRGVSNPDQLTAMRERVGALRAADPGQTALVPIDLVTASGSGLDPHISVAAARYQASRVAKARGIPTEQVQKLVDELTEGRQFGLLGERRVNVLRLNLALDELR